MPKDEGVPVPVLSLDPPSESIASLPDQDPLGAEQLAADAETPRRRRRRTKKVDPQPPTPEGGTTPEDLARCEAALGLTFTLLSKVAAKRRGPHWELDAEEAQSLGQAWTAALAPYLPKIGAAVPWATAAVVTWTMIQPRLAEDAAIAAAKPEAPGGPALVTRP